MNSGIYNGGEEKRPLPERDNAPDLVLVNLCRC